MSLSLYLQGRRNSLTKSHDGKIHHPGTHGSHKWYVNAVGDVVYGDRPLHPGKGRHQPGDMWEAEGGPEGHRWYQGKVARYLFAPTGDVMRHGEGAHLSLTDNVRREPEKIDPKRIEEYKATGRSPFFNTANLMASPDLIHVGRTVTAAQVHPDYHDREDVHFSNGYVAARIMGRKPSTRSGEAIPGDDSSYEHDHSTQDDAQKMVAHWHDRDLERLIWDTFNGEDDDRQGGDFSPRQGEHKGHVEDDEPFLW